MRIGIDAGGTFTDFVVLDDRGSLTRFKLPSNPADPASVILAGIARAAGSVKHAEVVHGSTVATNALLERKGARTAFVTTAGFEDLLAIGRQNRAELYNLTPLPRQLLVPRERCFGVAERVHANGEVERRPSKAMLGRLKRALRDSGVESVAICLLHSYAWPDHERLIAEALAGECYVSASSDIAPEFREYERASTVAINAYVGPLMQGYLSTVAARCPYPLVVMQSNGGVLAAAEASRHAVRTILSGPAGGAVGAMEIARRAGFDRVIAFDMGGTSTDVSICDGRIAETLEATVDGMPVRAPMLDIHTIGAGGGSIARMDEGGLLRVGPESAGADPGPASYGRGKLPTVTDAHVVLGHVNALLGGDMPLDRDRAKQALESLGMTATAAARAVLRVANANMERAIRAVSVERGHDPREFALLAFGGGGALHACALAESLGMTTVLVPEDAGVLSALGMLAADRVRDYAAGVLKRANVQEVLNKLGERARSENPGSKLEQFADLRYAGQSYELTVPWRGAARAFEQLHQRTYGYRMNAALEVVTVRVRATRKTQRLRLRATSNRPAQGRGPVVIRDYGSTVLVPKGWRFRTDATGTMVIERRG